MKKILIIFSIFIFASQVFADEKLTAKKVTAAAAEKDTVEESIEYLESQVNKVTDLAEKRSIYIFLGSLQELLSFYDDAQATYVKAAGIAAGNGEGMPPRSNEQIVLDAVRCALNNGDYATADSYLNSAVKKSKNETIQAYIKLYTQWSALCRASNVKETEGPIAVLDSYLSDSSMEVVRSSILLTLWYITGDSKYSDTIKKDYPSSVEMSVVKGEIQLLPTPFWFFVPKSGDADFSSAETQIKDLKNVPQVTEKQTENLSKAKWQIGFFRTEGNALSMCNELKEKGFKPYIREEKRASGTIYYQVIIDEDSSGKVADKIRSAGYDCCLLE